MGTASSPTVALKAPVPAAPYQLVSGAGAWTTPRTGSPFSIRAILTVNWSLRLMNSLVPSSGSISQ
jgi:hypothetical protein